MKGSPFSRGLRKGGKHMHHHRGRFMEHIMRHCMDGHESSSSSGEECHSDRQTESGNDMQHRMEYDHGMKSKMKHHFGKKHGMKHHFGMKHGMRRGHGMMHRKKHGHDMMHREEHGHDMMHGMRHGHGMMHEMRHGHGMMHEMRHGHSMMHKMRHGPGMMHGMRHGHGMKHLHDMKHGKRHEYTVEHRRKHYHGMKHKMHHGHGRNHKMGHGPGMHHKLRYHLEKSYPGNLNEERPLEVDIENTNESEAFTFYGPKTSTQVINENNKFQIILETSYYQPEEVSVKIVNGKIDVSAMHESMEDDLYEFHEMYRSFNIPNNVNPEVITARLATDGKLIIEAACDQQAENSPTEQERDIPVIRVSE